MSIQNMPQEMQDFIKKEGFILTNSASNRNGYFNPDHKLYLTVDFHGDRYTAELSALYKLAEIKMGPFSFPHDLYHKFATLAQGVFPVTSNKFN